MESPHQEDPVEAPPEQAGGIPSGAVLVTKPQVASLAQVDVRTVERWDARGALPGKVRLPGRAVRWRKEVVLAWLGEGCPPPSQWPPAWRARKGR